MLFELPRFTERGVVCFAVCLSCACGVSDRKVNEGSGGSEASSGSGGSNGGGDRGGMSAGGRRMINFAGSGDQSGEAGEAGSAGEAGFAGEPGAGGTGGTAGTAGIGGVPPKEPDCINDSLRCENSMVPSKCVEGVWIDQAPCPVSKPACSNGVCAAATLTGGIVTVSNGVLSTSNVRLVEHGLEYTQTTCGMVGTQNVCVTGGIRP